MTTLPDPEPLPEAFENPDESNVELAKAAASDLLSGKKAPYTWVRTVTCMKGFFKAIRKSSESVCKNSGVSRDVTF
jgi:hypothetical protein